MGFSRSWATIGEYLAAGRLKGEWRSRFSELERFVLFLGYPRSGHSLVGSILDAHPEAIFAHEQDILRYLKYGFDRERLFALLIRNSIRTAEGGRNWSGYSYELPGQYQGNARTLRVLGDKKGANSTRRLARDPMLLDRLEEKVRVPIRIVHVKRDPFDNISRMILRDRKKKGKKPERKDFRRAIDHYFYLADTISGVRERGWEDGFIDVSLEDLIADPRKELSGLLQKLGLPVEEEHLEAASKLLFDAPKRASEELEWPEELKQELWERLERSRALEGE